MAKHTSPKRAPQRPLGPPDGPQQRPPDPSSTPDEAEQGQPPLCVYATCPAEYDAAHEDHS